MESQEIEELKRILSEEQEKSKAKTLFLEMVMHELCSDLSVLFSVIDILKVQLRSVKNKKLLGEMQQAVNRINGMIQQVIAIGKLQNPTAIPQTTSCDPVAVANDVIASVTSGGNDDIIHFSITGKVVKPVPINPAALRFILLILLGNALKYSKNDGHIVLHFQFQPAQLRIVVCDDGCGMPSSSLQVLFNAFVRGENTRHYSGLGIGLSIVKHCVDLCHGTIEVHSKENVGSTFVICLPILKEKHEGLPPSLTDSLPNFFQQKQ